MTKPTKNIKAKILKSILGFTYKNDKIDYFEWINLTDDEREKLYKEQFAHFLSKKLDELELEFKMLFETKVLLQAKPTQSAADNFYEALRDNPDKVIEWAEREIEEYKKIIELIKKGIKK